MWFCYGKRSWEISKYENLLCDGANDQLPLLIVNYFNFVVQKAARIKLLLTFWYLKSLISDRYNCIKNPKLSVIGKCWKSIKIINSQPIEIKGQHRQINCYFIHSIIELKCERSEYRKKIKLILHCSLNSIENIFSNFISYLRSANKKNQSKSSRGAEQK